MSNVIPLRRRPAGDVAPPPSDSGSSWGFLALLGVGFAVMEGLKYWSGSHEQSAYYPRGNPTDGSRYIVETQLNGTWWMRSKLFSFDDASKEVQRLTAQGWKARAVVAPPRRNPAGDC